jgi:hypothetical protein
MLVGGGCRCGCDFRLLVMDICFQPFLISKYDMNVIDFKLSMRMKSHKLVVVVSKFMHTIKISYLPMHMWGFPI